jgi:hypothetical protein
MAVTPAPITSAADFDALIGRLDAMERTISTTRALMKIYIEGTFPDTLLNPVALSPAQLSAIIAKLSTLITSIQTQAAAL